MEHVDHKFDDFVSEFVWVSCGGDVAKNFFIRDADGDKRYVRGCGAGSGEGPGDSYSPPSSESAEPGACVWFDDHFQRCHFLHASCTTVSSVCGHGVRGAGS